MFWVFVSNLLQTSSNVREQNSGAAFDTETCTRTIKDSFLVENEGNKKELTMF